MLNLDMLIYLSSNILPRSLKTEFVHNLTELVTSPVEMK